MSIYHLLLCDAILIGRWVPKLQTTLLPPYCHFSTLKMEATDLPKRWYPSTSQHRSTSQKTSNLVRSSHFIHFNTWEICFMSTGKHRCMGETLAKSNVFLFTASLLQNFNFSVPPGSLPPSTDAVDGVTPSPKPFQALVTPRAVGWTVFIQGGCTHLQGTHYDTEEKQTVSSLRSAVMWHYVGWQIYMNVLDEAAATSIRVDKTAGPSLTSVCIGPTTVPLHRR